MASKPKFEIKPTAFKRGVPKAEHNGLFGIEDQLVEMPIGRDIPAIVTYRMSDDVQKRGDGVRYPEVEIVHIEPIWDEEARFELQGLLQAAYKERTGQDQLDFSGIESKAKESPEDGDR